MMNTLTISTSLNAMVAKDISDSDIESFLNPPIIEEKKEMSYEEAYLAAFNMK